MQDEEILGSQQPRLLQNLGTRALFFARYVASRAVQLPTPLGTSITIAEEFFAPAWEPIVHVAENQGLHFLKFLDDRIYAVGEAIENYIHSAMNVISYPRKVVAEVHRRGIVGSTADAWVELKDPVTTTIQQFPGSALVSGLAGALGLGKISDWLVDYSQAKGDEKSLKHQTSEEHPQEDEKEEVDHPYVEAKLVDDQLEIQAGDVGDKEEEDDELTKLLEAGWSLGSL